MYIWVVKMEEDEVDFLMQLLYDKIDYIFVADGRRCLMFVMDWMANGL